MTRAVTDMLVFEVPAQHVDEWRDRLHQHYAGKHVVRDRSAARSS